MKNEHLITAIITVTARVAGIERVEMFHRAKSGGLSKRKRVAYPRSVALVVIREKLNTSLSETARVFDMHHTAVLLMVKRVEQSEELTALKQKVLDAWDEIKRLAGEYESAMERNQETNAQETECVH